ncbi:MAG: T9SS type A sorting domain-containing protein [Dysgonamonadaceae bacterium]|jgi:hypothetical protein|nr:T9SS type A sorting domain-containing protein [Dysgonamonadaceae bacterium]
MNMKNSTLSLWAILLLLLAGWQNANAQFLENTEKVDVVQIPAFDGDGAKTQRYLADVGGVILFAVEQNEASQWYKIPAGGVSNGTEDVQAYYYKNVATGNYLAINDATLAQLITEREGDWPTEPAAAYAENDKSLGFKWFERPSNWGWGIFLSNAAGIDLTARENNQIFCLTSITIMKNEGEEFFGVYFPNAAVGGFAGGGGNAWTAVKTPVVVSAQAANPDYKHFDKNTPTVNVVQFTTWMTPNNAKLGGAKPYAADNAGAVEYVTDATAESSKWYEIPAGEGAFEQQVYYYKNVATGAYLVGSTRTPGEGGDWTVSAAATSAVNDYSNLYKWSKVATPNWGAGAWLVNEEGNTGQLPSGDNKNAFFALTMLTANSEFFGVDVPNVAISNPHEGSNAWTAVQINTVGTAANPDYVGTGLEYSIKELNFFATDGGEDANAASYDAATHTITYKNGGWHRAGWNWEPTGGIDVSDYNQVWIKFDASALPKTGDGEGGATKIQFDVVYMDDTNAADDNGKTNEIRSNNTEYFYNLAPGKKIKRITLKSEAEGNIVLTDAYFYNKAAEPCDLIITDVAWYPTWPAVGEEVWFCATVKNISESPSQNVKHGVTFAIKNQGAAGNGTIVAWSDTHHTALQPGEEVTLVSNGGPGNSVGSWKPTTAQSYTLVAQVNDQNDVSETDVTNNFFSKDFAVTVTGISETASVGYIYTAKGKIYPVNFPENAAISVYNLQAQKIGDYKTGEVSKQTFAAGMYIVKIQVGAKSSSVKVLVK